MKKFIIFILVMTAIIGSIIYFVFSSDRTLLITYIKFNTNPEFIIGVNNKDQVNIYNPLNDDAKILNLSMFNGMEVEEASKVIVKTLKDKDYVLNNEINITVITKNPDKITDYYDKINRAIEELDSNIVLINKRATNEELLAYSNEVAYDVKATFNNDNLLSIATNIESDIKGYIDEKVESLKIADKNVTEQETLINEKLMDGYFNDYDLLFYTIADYDLSVMDRSNYSIVFDNELNYTITLNLELENSHIITNNDKDSHIIEVYSYTYSNGSINNVKSNFYKYS